jgi:hypothetical protein
MDLPLLILAGIPRGVYIRHKDFTPEVAGWNLIMVNSRSERADLSNSWEEVQELANNAVISAHIFSFHTSIEGRERFEKDVYSRHRLVWLEKEMLSYYGNPEFNEELQRLANFESEWCSRVRPNAPNECLILPESTFSPNKAFRDTWKRSQRVRINFDNLDSIESLLNSFRQDHMKNDTWLDRRELVFNYKGERHAFSKRHWQWKFTYLLPHGFHFDVRHQKENHHFTLVDCAGISRQFTTYTNVDPHGYVRGGH